MIAHWDLAFPIIPLGWECLQIFFVLSGFLITRILLHERDKVSGFGRYIKVFYYKRAFRIFPLYFAYILFWHGMRLIMRSSEFIQTQTSELEHSAIWMYTYLYNFSSLFNFNAGIDAVAPQNTRFFAHLWSLSVEEQFYLFFPFVIFFLRGRILKGAIILLIVLPQLTRLVGFPYLMSVNADPTWATLLIYRNIVFQYDSLALGAALAIFNFAWIKQPRLWLYMALTLMVGLWIYNFPYIQEYLAHYDAIPFKVFLNDAGRMNWLGYIHALGHPEILQVNYQYLYMIPLVNVICFLIVICSLRGQSILKWLFENRIMIYLGKISYGMYVFHYCVMVFFMKVIRALLPPSVITGNFIIHILLFFLYLGAVILVSHLSFKYFESIFLKLKNKVRA